MHAARDNCARAGALTLLLSWVLLPLLHHRAAELGGFVQHQDELSSWLDWGLYSALLSFVLLFFARGPLRVAGLSAAFATALLWYFYGLRV